MTARPLLGACAIVVALGGCKPTGRSVRAWIESRAPDGRIVSGATVEVDGESIGMTDERGTYRLKIRRDVGSRFSMEIRGAGASWERTFTVGTDGLPVESNDGPGRIIAVLGAEPASTHATLPPPGSGESACSKDDEQPCTPLFTASPQPPAPR